MFRKLRNSILVLNLVATSVMMLAAFGAIYLVTWSNVQRDIGRDLARISESGQQPASTRPAAHPPKPWIRLAPAASVPRREPATGPTARSPSP